MLFMPNIISFDQFCANWKQDEDYRRHEDRAEFNDLAAMLLEHARRLEEKAQEKRRAAAVLLRVTG